MEHENGQVWTKFYQKWALNFFIHLNAHFTISSVLVEHIVYNTPLYLLFLRHNNDLKNSRPFLLWQILGKIGTKSLRGRTFT